MFTAKFFDFESGMHKMMQFKSLRMLLIRADKEYINSVSAIQDLKRVHDCRRDSKGAWFIYKTFNLDKDGKRIEE